MNHLVLIGGGLTHLEVIRRLVRAPLPGTEITLVAQERKAVYAGMLPGVVAGHYARDDMTVDLAALAARAGIGFQQGRAVGLDAVARMVRLEDGTAMDYTLASLNTGATAKPVTDPRYRAVLPIKPAPQFLARLQAWESGAAGDAPVGVIGGGVAGVEMVFALAYRWRRVPRPLSLVDTSGDRLASVPKAARSRVRHLLRQAGITVHTPESVPPLDLALNAAGAAAPDWLGRTGLSLTAQGFVAIRPTLQTETSETVFASGDVATITAHPRAKAGVFAVRQGPVLFDNLRRVLSGQPPRAYRPQKVWLSLIATGGQHAIATRNGVALSGRWVWWFKDLNDRGYLARYRNLT